MLTLSRASCDAAACRHRAQQQPMRAPARSISLQPAALLCLGALRWRQASSTVSISRTARLRCRADSDDEAEQLAEGTRVRVKQSIMVYHAPKRKEGLDLEGMEGEVQAYVDDYKGKKLSTKFFTHLVSAMPHVVWRGCCCATGFTFVSSFALICLVRRLARIYWRGR